MNCDDCDLLMMNDDVDCTCEEIGDNDSNGLAMMDWK